MIFEHNKLKGLIKEKGYTQKEVAIYIRRSPSVFSLQINGKKRFNQEDIQGMMELLEIPNNECVKYFFNLKV